MCLDLHDWIVEMVYNPLADDDSPMEICAQCGVPRWEEELPDDDDIDGYGV